MFFHLPIELQNYIWSFDPGYRNHFDRVVHQLNMRKVWKTARVSPKERWITRIPKPIHHSYVETNVRDMIRFQKILGPIKKRPYTSRHFIDYMIDSFLLYKASIYSDLFI